MKAVKFKILLLNVLCLIVAVNAAVFERLQYNNPGLEVDLGVGLWAWPLPMDYDNDGDYDLVVSCTDKPYRGTYFFENTSGNVKMPVFKPPVKIADGIGNVQISYIDGKPRVLSPAKEHKIFSEKPLSETTKIFSTTKVHGTSGRIRANQWKYCDFDGDGSLDIIVGIGDWADYGWDNAYDENGVWQNGPLRGYVYLIKNNGSNEEPDYEEPRKINAAGKPIDVYGMPSPNIADFDGDGDLDIMCGEFVDKFTYFENIGTRNNPKYAAGRYLKYQGNVLTMDLCMIVPVAVDWDRDGDFDLVVGQEDGRVAFIENTGEAKDGLPQFLQPVFFKQQAADLKFGALVTPCSYDWDGDGDEDLVCGNTAGYIGFIENLGMKKGMPVWAEPVYLEADGEVIRIMAGINGSIQGPCERKWGYTVVTVADWDHDGLADIIANSILGEIVWFKNIGTKVSPKLAAAEKIKVEWQTETPPKPDWNWKKPENNELITQWRTSVAVRDFTGDGLNDLAAIDHEGYLSLFERFPENGELKLRPGQRVFTSKGASEYDAKGKALNDTDGLLRLNSGVAGRSGRRKFCFADWNNDGRPDLLVNSINVNYLENISKSANGYMFQDEGQVGEHVLAGHTTCPTAVNWNGSGKADLLIGGEDGCFYYCRNPYQTSE
ncbi:hypothetical protein SMSP2_01520 [Limihaloglobus sulfuriphilus]|uniref:FG-GAP repeat n=1 Tax=Limihaloglobus sulfuriphilus TaxID=1851148 RepID=A0A1Q2MEM5_9BACT|nr:VCBS repeat-containing protein [Limihaloglobus sulfuriphilus]AQQ71155.1 hypothetical protein SMSP2_01520 [Limihaloglobus sulfuriphilus]